MASNFERSGLQDLVLGLTEAKICRNPHISIRFENKRKVQLRQVITCDQTHTLMKSKARFPVTVISQMNKSAVYFSAMRNVKFGCSKFDVKSGVSIVI